MRFLFVLFIISLQQVMLAQGPQFLFSNKATESKTVKFKEINNLILLPVEVNQKDSLYFILDTGAENIILFGSEFKNAPIEMENLRSIKLGGLGPDENVEAFVSQQNQMNIEGIIGENLNFIYVEDDLVKFSDLLGHPVHGILGIEIFHHFIVQVNYYNSTVTFISPETFKPRRKFRSVDISILKNRPYIELNVELHPRINLITNLLIDLGESKPLSLYLDSHELIFLPEPNFEANLGKGLAGVVTGKVARINSIVLDRYTMKNVVTAFPNPEDIVMVSNILNRNGSLGAGILKRFIVAFDLKKKKLHIKKSGFLRQSFTFDRTGLIIIAEGENFDEFRISGVIEGSAGDRAGFKEGDKIIAIGEDNLVNKKIGNVLNIIETSGRKFFITIKRGSTEKVLKMHFTKL